MHTASFYDEKTSQASSQPLTDNVAGMTPTKSTRHSVNLDQCESEQTMDHQV